MFNFSHNKSLQLMGSIILPVCSVKTKRLLFSNLLSYAYYNNIVDIKDRVLL